MYFIVNYYESKQKKRRLVKSRIKNDAREISLSSKVANVSPNRQSDQIPNVKRNSKFDHKATLDNHKLCITISESSSEDVMMSTENIFEPTISESSDEARVFTTEYESLIFENKNFVDENYILSQSSTSGSDSEPEININDFLRNWWNSYTGLPLDALNSLLKGLRQWFPSLPADSRALLKTPRTLDILNFENGQYHNFGLNKMLVSKLNSLPLESIDTLHLNVNIDGLPLHKSTNAQFWPILVTLNEDPESNPFITSIFHGKTKPPLNDFIIPFINEFNDLEKNGINFKGKIYGVKIRSFICDAPAKAFVKGIKGHTGYYGCDKCSQVGVYVNQVLTFPEIDAPERTNVSFRSKLNPEHHRCETPLLDLNIDLVKAFPHDYMHLVCLGVTRRLLSSWAGKNKYRNGRLASRDIVTLSTCLIESRKYWPSEFNRYPRSLLELDHWKATECRQFLLYLGPVFLKSILHKDLYKHFLLLHCGIAILASSDLHLSMNETAKDFLKKFVELAPKYYGSEIQTYNMHSLIHLNEDVKNFDTLDSFSAFPFENFLQKVKK